MGRFSIPHLLHRGGIYYFRAKVPTNKRTFVAGLREVKLSLKTDDENHAKLLCRQLSNAFEICFRQIQPMPHLAIQDIHNYVRQYFQEELNHAYLMYLDLPSDPGVDLNEEIASLREDQAAFGKRLGRRQFTSWEKFEATKLVENLKPGSSSIDLDGWDVAYEGVLRAKIAKYRYLVAALSGDTEGLATADPMFAGMVPEAIALPSSLPQWKPAGTSLKDAIGKFLEKQIKSGVAAKSLADFQRCLGWFERLTGRTRPAESVTTEDIKSFRDTLECIPVKIGTYPEFAGKDFLEIVQMKHGRPIISAATQKKYFIMLRTFLNWCATEEIISKIPGANVKLHSQGDLKKGEAPVHPYSAEQLYAIFSSPVYQGCKSVNRRLEPGTEVIRDAYYWIPIVGLLTGMRLGEIVQLLLADIRNLKGIAYFDVNELGDDDKTLKTISSKRKIPIPSLLIDLGFLKFIETRRAEKASRLFEEIQSGADGYYSSNFSKWWTRYSRKIGFYYKETRFHSFRHCFKDAIAGAEVLEVISKALMGHSDASVHASYGTGPSLEKLKDGIDKAIHEVDLKALLITSSST